MRYIKATCGEKLLLSCDNLQVIKWHVDSSFAVHADFRSHTGGTMTYGQGDLSESEAEVEYPQ
jgi:hypothetical protein